MTNTTVFEVSNMKCQFVRGRAVQGRAEWSLEARKDPCSKKVSSAKVMDHEDIKTLLDRARRSVPRLAYLHTNSSTDSAEGRPRENPILCQAESPGASISRTRRPSRCPR